MIPTIYLDMDGVCCDFVTATLELHGSPLKPEDIGKWNMEEIMGLTLDEFWAPIEAKGADFWRGLKEYPWFKELYDICKASAKEVVFLSSPDRSPTAAMGKMQWLMDRFGGTFRDYILTPRKDLVSTPMGLLIDDSERYCEMWAKDGEGGPCLLFPQPWNRRGTTDMTKYLKELEAMLGVVSKAYEVPQ